MANSVTFKLEGAKELQRRLFKLDDKIQNKILKGAVRKAARPVVKDARKRVPKDSGLLRDSIGTFVKKYKRSSTAVAVIGSRRTFSVSKRTQTTASGAQIEHRNPAFYAHLVEFGTKQHFQPVATIGSIVIKGFQHPGTKPQPFLEPAFKANERKAFNIMNDELGKHLKAAGA